MTDPTKDPLTQIAWDWVIETLQHNLSDEVELKYLEPPLAERVDELISALGRLRHNYMAMTMIQNHPNL